jgi:hypothetical protein
VAWKLPLESEWNNEKMRRTEKVSKMADVAVMSFLKILCKMHKSKKL